ncbi:hypothetical protein ACQPXH_29315 [Nocardia sp. CA-135953]|uniref:hypothetical protein n=1 Tax=Nocardia sp. CA-135953 TaxID=3239978 RepID=UPI003D9571AB
MRGSLRHPRTVGGFDVIAVAGVQASFLLSRPYLQVGVTLMIQFLVPIAWNWAVRGRRPSGATDRWPTRGRAR